MVSIHFGLLLLIFTSWTLLYITVSFTENHVLWKLHQNTEGSMEIKPKIDPCAMCWPSFNKTETQNTINWYYFNRLNNHLATIQMHLSIAEKQFGRQYKYLNTMKNDMKNLQKSLQRLYSENHTMDARTSTSDQTVPSSEKYHFLSSITLLIEEELFKTTIKKSIRKYRNLNVIVATNQTLQYEKWPNIQIYTETHTSKSALYNALVDLVKTKYTFVANNLIGFGLESLHKLEERMIPLGVWAISGGLRYKDTFSTGCWRSVYRNYIARWAPIQQKRGCHVCSYLEGPFLADTNTLRLTRWNDSLPFHVANVNLFLQVTHYHNLMASSCSQVTFTVSKDQKFSNSDAYQIAKIHNIMRIQLPRMEEVSIECSEILIDCQFPSEIGSPCCLKELADMITLLMKVCENNRIYCELQEGTLLGAVKFGNVLPWERDADITFLTANFTALSNLAPTFSEAGYTLKMTDNRWCCVNGSMAGGQGVLLGDHWVLELWSQHAMDSADQVQKHGVPTRILFNNQWVLSPNNPGRHVRNRYGHEIYKHIQHWMELGKQSSWELYQPSPSFGTCSRPGYHACLDLFPPDGSLTFKIPRVK